jgi:hypothetical protein
MIPVPIGDGDVRTMQSICGDGHRFLVTIEDLEASDAVEQTVEEMADDHMCWFDGINTVARQRRAWYLDQYTTIPAPENSRAAMLRRTPDISLHQRALEFAELNSMLVGDRLLSNDELETGFPPMNTNRSYWGLRNMNDLYKLLDQETKYFISVPDGVQRVYDMLPWLQERGWSEAPLMLLRGVCMFQRGDQHAMKLLEQASREAQTFNAQSIIKTWIESRKPGVDLRERPRSMHAVRMQRTCECCDARQ